MTIWMPDLSSLPGPRYLAIADALAADLAAGQLSADERLPTHRDLAYRLGITVGTVSRGYAEAHRRGLIAGEVGRGTYIQGDGGKSDQRFDLSVHEATPELFDFSLNLPAKGPAVQVFADTLGELSRSNSLGPLLEYQPDIGMRKHREAGAEWLAMNGLKTAPDNVVAHSCDSKPLHSWLGAISTSISAVRVHRAAPSATRIVHDSVGRLNRSTRLPPT